MLRSRRTGFSLRPGVGGCFSDIKHTMIDPRIHDPAAGVQFVVFFLKRIDFHVLSIAQLAKMRIRLIMKSACFLRRISAKRADQGVR